MRDPASRYVADFFEAEQFSPRVSFSKRRP